jgi:NADPH-dependent curcumin reductase CurA
MRPYGRIALCGAISQYNVAGEGIRNLSLAIGKRLTLRGYIVSDHNKRMPEFLTEMGGWLREGKVRYDETVVDGLENAPAAFMGMLAGENTGKMIVRLAA